MAFYPDMVLPTNACARAYMTPFSISAFLPLILLVTIGFMLRRHGGVVEEFWQHANRLCYYLFLPCLLVTDLAQAQLDFPRVASALTATTTATVLVGLLAIIICRGLSIQSATMTSVFQGSIRFNSYVFLALTSFLFGPAGTAMASLFIAPMIVVTSVWSVYVLKKNVGGNTRQIGSVLLTTLGNPLTVSSVIGIALNFANILPPAPIQGTLAYLGASALPISLLAVGAGLRVDRNDLAMLPVGIACGLKLVALPLTSVSLLHVLGVGGFSAKIGLLYGSLPCAASSYVLARQLGGDSKTMATIISASTVVSMISIPLWLSF